MDKPLTTRGLAALISRVTSTTAMLRHGASFYKINGNDSAVLLRDGFNEALKVIDDDVGMLLSLIPDQPLPEIDPEPDPEPEPEPESAEKAADE